MAQSNTAFFDFNIGEQPIPGVIAPMLLVRGDTRRGIILGKRVQLRGRGRGQGGNVLKPVGGAQTVLASMDSPPVFGGRKLRAGRVVKRDGRHLIVKPGREYNALILHIRTGLPTDPRKAFEMYVKRAGEGITPTSHGYLVDDGTKPLASFEEVTDPESVSSPGAPGLISHLKWAVAKDRVPETDIPYWREDLFELRDGASLYVFGPYGQTTRLINHEGILRQEEVMGDLARVEATVSYWAPVHPK